MPSADSQKADAFSACRQGQEGSQEGGREQKNPAEENAQFLMRCLFTMFVASVKLRPVLEWSRHSQH
jgi:hypothetical protein